MSKIEGLTSKKTTMLLLSLAIAISWAGGREPKSGKGETPQTRITESSNAELIEHLVTHSMNDEALLQVDHFVRKLGSEQFEERENAMKQILAAGFASLPLLRTALRGPDAEVRSRAERCIGKIEENRERTDNAIRRIALNRVVGGEVALIRVLPYLSNDQLEADAWFALEALVSNQTRPNSAVTDALQDRLSIRRAAAGFVLAHSNQETDKADINKCLADPCPVVRLRTAQGLLARKEKRAIPALISLLDIESVSLAWQAEELLRWVAGESSPEVILGTGSPEARRLCRESWKRWWGLHEKIVNLELLAQAPRRPLLLLVSGRNEKENRNETWICGSDGKSRWELHLGTSQVAVQWLQGERVLIRDWKSGVSERDLEGKTLWQHEGKQIVAARRLPNGATLIVEFPHRAVMVSAAGRALGSVPLSTESGLQCLAPYMLSNEKLVFAQLTTEQVVKSIVEIDPGNGQATRHVNVPKMEFDQSLWVETFAREGYLVLVPKEKRVVELDNCGKIRSEYKLNGATFARVLRDGNTLFSPGQTQHHRVIECDNRGRIVWEVQSPISVVHLEVCCDLVRLGLSSYGLRNIDLSTSVPYRLKGLASKEADMRCFSAEMLGSLGSKAVEAVPVLILALDDSDRRVQEWAKLALEQIGAPAIPSAFQALQDERPRIRGHAINLLNTFHRQQKLQQGDMRAFRAVLQAYEDQDPYVRLQAVRCSSIFRFHGAKAVPTLMKALRDNQVVIQSGNTRISTVAALILGELGEIAEDAVPALIEAAQRDEEDLATTAICTLGRIGGKNPHTIPALAKILKDTARGRNRGTAAASLGELGKAASDVVPDLVDVLNTPREVNVEIARFIRLQVLSALKHIGPSAKTALPSLITILQDKQVDRELRQASADAIGRVGVGSDFAIEALTKALHDPDETVKEAAAVAIASLRR